MSNHCTECHTPINDESNYLYSFCSVPCHEAYTDGERWWQDYGGEA